MGVWLVCRRRNCRAGGWLSILVGIGRGREGMVYEGEKKGKSELGVYDVSTSVTLL
jgi:hypothetical protein